MEFVSLNQLTAKPGRRDRLVEILLESGRLFDDNPACRLYLVAESADEPSLVWVADLWTSEEEHAEALKVPEMRPFVEQVHALARGHPEPRRRRTAGVQIPTRSDGGRAVAHR